MSSSKSAELDVLLASMRAIWRFDAQSAPGSQLFERDGVMASIVPATPDRSVFNSVLYESADGLAEALDDLGARYDEAGVRAWTVWVPEADTETARLLEGAGHRLDAEPRAMILDLEGEIEVPERVDWTVDADFDAVCRINDIAYDYPLGTFAAGLGSGGDDQRHYMAAVDGQPAACVCALDHEGDCGIYWVATLPEARGRGLSAALMRIALAEGKGRGCTTSTLEATAMGRPVYERIGYRDLGALQMWERRR